MLKSNIGLMLRLKSILTLVFIMTAVDLYSQNNSLFHNTCVSFGIGPDAYVRDGSLSVGGGAEVAFGKWILNTAGVRGQLSGQYAGSQLYTYADLDFFFDPITSIKGRSHSIFWRSYVIVGIGAVHGINGDNDFSGNIGLGVDYVIGNNFRLYAELKNHIHPSGFDNNANSSLLTLLSFGSIYDIDNNPTRSRSRFETQGLKNDCFFQVSMGVSSFNYKGIESMNQRLSLLTPIVEFSIGKQLNTHWLVRVSASGLYARSEEELFTYYNIRGDIILDVITLFAPNGYSLPFALRPYVSTGVVARLDDQSNFLVSATAGMMAVYKFSKNNELFLDARYLMTPPRFAHVSQPQSSFSVGLFTLAIGYSYMFTKSSFR